MGLLNKLKNVLFEEEEIEEVKEEKVEPKSTMDLPKINKEPKKETSYNVENETDRELFKAEKTFDFPAFDEEEFEDYTPKVELQIQKVEPEKRVNHSYSRKKEYTSTRIVKNEEETPKKVFKPSPVMSPVYGILDKNYKKEDVVTREEIGKKKNVKLDVDSVRKKAFGTLEEDLEKTLNEPLDLFYEDENIEIEEKEKNDLENLLENTVDIEIDVTKEMEIPSKDLETSYEDTKEIEMEENIEEKEVEDVVIEPLENEPEEKEDNEVTDDTLENDLFDLIDSMYENREDEE